MASKRTAKKVVSKEDLRRLMKEQKTILNTAVKRVDSPLAKYNSYGELSCVVCKCPVKSNLQWSAHVLGRLHKENVERVRTSATNSALPLPSQALLTNQKKRKAPKSLQDDDHLFKVPKVMSSMLKLNQSSRLPADFFDSSSSATSSSSVLPSAMSRPNDRDSSSSEDDSDSEDEKMEDSAPSTLQPSTGGQLPPDFFDAKVPVIADEVIASTVTEKLPEGFFDDPKMDAKARHVAYRDKMDVEYESFEKEMKEQTMVSEALLEEDDDKRDAERDIYQLDDNINRWSNVHQLEIKKEKIQSQRKEAVVEMSDEDDSSDTDLTELDEASNNLWRSKTSSM